MTMTTLIKIDIDKSYENRGHETEIITSALLDLYGSFDLMRADHTFFDDSDDLLDYIEYEGSDVKLHATEFNTYLKGILNELAWNFL